MIRTTHSYRELVFIIRCRPHEPFYTVDFPDLPDIITSGETLAEEFAKACEAADLHVENLQKLGRRLPERKHGIAVRTA
jgi:predicted RNase H-like HicB family nuclease